MRLEESFNTARTPSWSPAINRVQLWRGGATAVPRRSCTLSWTSAPARSARRATATPGNMDALNRGPVDLERIMSAPTFCLLGTKTGDQEVRSVVQETVLLIS
jgi:hypothetical protein